MHLCKRDHWKHKHVAKVKIPDCCSRLRPSSVHSAQHFTGHHGTKYNQHASELCTSAIHKVACYRGERKRGGEGGRRWGYSVPFHNNASVWGRRWCAATHTACTIDSMHECFTTNCRRDKTCSYNAFVAWVVFARPLKELWAIRTPVTVVCPAGIGPEPWPKHVPQRGDNSSVVVFERK